MNLFSFFRSGSDTDNDTKVILISCNETFLSPKSIIEEEWGVCKEILLPGALLGENEQSEKTVLQSLLETYPETKHLVVSLHSLCTFFADTKQGTELNQLEAEVQIEFAELDFVSRRVFLQQRWLQRLIPKLEKYSRDLGCQNLSIHGWLYEPETKWISALENETGEFVPLNVYSTGQISMANGQ